MGQVLVDNAVDRRIWRGKRQQHLAAKFKSWFKCPASATALRSGSAETMRCENEMLLRDSRVLSNRRKWKIRIDRIELALKLNRNRLTTLLIKFFRGNKKT